MKNHRGFTLLEMLLALSLGALLMGTISAMVMPLLQQHSIGSATDQSFDSQQSANDFIDNMDRIASKGIGVFPNSLDLGQKKTSLAIQFLGSGDDPTDDANGDGVAGIAHMDSSADRQQNVVDAGDDDKDGEVDEDPINNLDDDNDGLIDEDPGNNSDNVDEPGAAHVDDNRDGNFDSDGLKTSLSTETKPWSPYLPISLHSKHQPESAVSYKSLLNFIFDERHDDNEDGITNNSPMITWTARLEGDHIKCTTPLVSARDDSKADNLSDFEYREYICLEHVSDFQVIRSIGPSGSAIFTITLSFASSGEPRELQHRLVFP